jgi:glutamine synthetase
VDSIINGTNYTDPEKSIMRIGVDVMPSIPKDTTDRNRTSPLAFTGNKFEFRMLGSSQSIAGPNIALNTIMAEELRQFADILENAEDFDKALHDLVCQAFTDHQRIIFSGNGYSEEWRQEAADRGLSNYPSTAQCMASYISQKNIDLVTSHRIFSETEFRARHAIQLETYVKTVNIEALTMVDMAQHQILPAALRYSRDLCDGIRGKKDIGIPCRAESALLAKISENCDKLYDTVQSLQSALAAAPAETSGAADYYHNVIVPGMKQLRCFADELEQVTDKSYWPYPTYSDILFY